MSLDSVGITHVGPPIVGGAEPPPFESTTKVVAEAGSDQLFYSSPTSVFFVNQLLDTLEEWNGSSFQPVEDGWYGVGGLMRCKPINLNSHNGRYVIRIYKNGLSGVLLFDMAWDAVPAGSGVVSCEFYNFVYLTSADTVSFFLFELSSAPVGILEGLSQTPSYIYFHRIL